MKKYKITIEWEIHSTKEDDGYYTGKSTLECEVKSIEELMNNAIDFANNIPSWEFKKNNIDIEEYRNKPYCRYYYRTQLSKIVEIIKVK